MLNACYPDLGFNAFISGLRLYLSLDISSLIVVAGVHRM